MSLDHNNIRYTSSPWGFRETPFAEQCRWAAKLGMKGWCGQFYPSPGLFSIERVKAESPGIFRDMKENGRALPASKQTVIFR
ncbi:MAG: hypothetical protein JNM63_04595 [Spirochaetia bacterium]|nr:hypothetical protein [Spirochaetia bacterium]